MPNSSPTTPAEKLLRLAALLSGLLAAACANPVPPTGGPMDETPPAVLEVTPAADAVNVSASSIRIRFSEYVDPNSFTQAFSITPEPEGRLDFDWDGRAVTITLPEPLRPNTTYILTLGTELRDVQSVALREPITRAFSTGPQINRGQLVGRVVEPRWGEGVANVDVYAYARPDSSLPIPLPERPDYRTQTDSEGRFQFAYLSEQPYFVVALQDRNRNRRPDPLEPFAVPPRPVFRADTTAGADVPRWLLTVLDTIPPEVQRLRALSSRRLELRFSEPVRLAARAPEAWSLRDSVRNQAVGILAVYTRFDAPRDVFLVTDSLHPVPHLLVPAAAVDTGGTPVRPASLRFVPATAADTTRLRFLGFVPDSGAAGPGAATPLDVLTVRQQPSVRFNQPLPEETLQQIVVATDTTGAPRRFAGETTDGTTYRLLFDPPLKGDETVRLQVPGAPVAAPDTTFVHTYRRLQQRNLGELTLNVQAADTAGAVVVELYTVAPDTLVDRAVLPAGGRFTFNNLLPVAYRFRAFQDRNGDLRWNGGLIAPYGEAEPLAWSQEITARARWEEVLADTLRIPAR